MKTQETIVTPGKDGPLNVVKVRTLLKRYIPYGPDGLTIRPDGPLCVTETDAWTALGQFVKRYEQQGYYSTMRQHRIPVADLLHGHCYIEVRWMDTTPAAADESAFLENPAADAAQLDEIKNHP